MLLSGPSDFEALAMFQMCIELEISLRLEKKSTLWDEESCGRRWRKTEKLRGRNGGGCV